MRACILCNRPDGGVSIIYPSPNCLMSLAIGGVIPTQLNRWRVGLWTFVLRRYGAAELGRFFLRGEVPIAVARAWEIHKFVRDPRWRPDRQDRERIAERWIDALIHGGVTGDDALRLICEKDAPPYSTAHEIVPTSDVPTDRRFRAAWARGHNGGPIRVCKARARLLNLPGWQSIEAT